MNWFTRTITKLGRKAAKITKKAATNTSRTAARKGTKLAGEKIMDSKSNAEWLIRVITSLPEYLRLYFSLLTDNRVSGKIKVIIITGVTALGTNYAFGGALFNTQMFLSNVLGPLAFLPTILILLITLDFCYKLIDSEVLAEHEKNIFGPDNSLQADIDHLHDFLGTSYEKLKEWWQRKADRVEREMQKNGLIVQGEVTDEAIQDISDQIVEIETSDELSKQIEKNVELLKSDSASASDALESLNRKLLEDK